MEVEIGRIESRALRAFFSFLYAISRWNHSCCEAPVRRFPFLMQTCYYLRKASPRRGNDSEVICQISSSRTTTLRRLSRTTCGSLAVRSSSGETGPGFRNRDPGSANRTGPGCRLRLRNGQCEVRGVCGGKATVSERWPGSGVSLSLSLPLSSLGNSNSTHHHGKYPAICVFQVTSWSSR